MTAPNGTAAPGWDTGYEELLRRVLPELDGITPDTDLLASGLDSLRIVELLVGLEDQYEVEIDDQVLTFETFATPGRLWSVVSDARRACARHEEN
ncbi:phosphopantetheine-binding protein [Kitasatospora viridis]|uniref:Acyl carrier protein n=1 Tax=Kitasatospora viridis TaxID=281105 RepID=A0A561UHU8_9ACTN|nr:phosphopantetheine-binding protein [Kitasatospora viridis]TWF98936.1 acyl carrier protein [Kitasatospora viridis]